MDISALMADLMVRNVACLACGTPNDVSNTNCYACDSFLVDDEAEESLDLVSDAEGATRQQDSRRNLRRLRQALQGIATGAIEVVEYQGHVEAVYATVSGIVAILHASPMQHRLELMTRRERALTLRTVALFDSYHSAVDQMRQFVWTQSFSDARDGFAAVEAAVQALTFVQREAEALPT